MYLPQLAAESPPENYTTSSASIVGHAGHADKTLLIRRSVPTGQSRPTDQARLVRLIRSIVHVNRPPLGWRVAMIR